MPEYAVQLIEKSDDEYWRIIFHYVCNHQRYILGSFRSTYPNQFIFLLKEGPGKIAYQIRDELTRLEGIAENPAISLLDSAIEIIDPLTSRNNRYVKGISFAIIAEKDDKSNDAHRLSQAILYHALYLYLSDQPDPSRFSRARLFCAWQWYNFVKPLNNEVSTSALDKKEKRQLNIEISEAYYQLYQLLEDPANTIALHWMQKLTGWKFKGSDTTLREKMIRSLFLEDNRSNEVPPHNPLNAPGLFINDDKINWDEVKLLNPFSEPRNTGEIQRYIHSFLLPRYDFSTALKMVSLMPGKTHGKQGSAYLQFNQYWHKVASYFVSHPIFTTILFAVFVLISIILGTKMVLSRDLALTYPTHCLFLVNLLQVVIASLPAMVIIIPVGINIIAYLSLPRLLGGIIVGYLALIFQERPDGISNIFWRNSMLTSSFAVSDLFRVIPLLLVVFGFGLMYIYFDIRPVVQESKLAFRRARFTLLIAVTMSALFGLIGSAASTAMVFSDPLAVNTFDYYRQWYFLGPVGWVDWRQYIIHIPLALLTGFVTQFIFEDKPLTAPAWSPEEPN